MAFRSHKREYNRGNVSDERNVHFEPLFIELRIILNLLCFLVPGIKALNNPRQDLPENIQNCSKERGRKIGIKILKTCKPFKSYFIEHFILVK